MDSSEYSLMSEPSTFTKENTVEWRSMGKQMNTIFFDCVSQLSRQNIVVVIGMIKSHSEFQEKIVNKAFTAFALNF